MKKNQYDSLVKHATNFAVISAILLLSGKILAWQLSHSMTMLASVFDSVVDIFTSVTNLILIRYALRPADKDHKFGHGKAEPLAALLQGTIIVCAVFVLIYHSIINLQHPKLLQMPFFAIIVTIISIFFTGMLLRYQHYVAKKTQSSAIKADMMHYQADFLLNIAVLVSLSLSWIGIKYADPFFSLLIGIYILYVMCHIFRDAIHGLMDKSLSDEITFHINNLAKSVELVRGVHGIKTRQSGKVTFIQLHLEFDDHLPIVKTHAIANKVERLLLENYPNSDILIHQDPLSVVEDEKRNEYF